MHHFYTNFLGRSLTKNKNSMNNKIYNKKLKLYLKAKKIYNIFELNNKLKNVKKIKKSIFFEGLNSDIKL